MTKSWTFALLFLTASAGFALGRFSMRTDPAFDPAHDLNPAHLSSVLGLSSAQAAEVEAIGAGYEKQISDACDDHCAARCQLALALRRDQLTREEAQVLVEKMCTSHKKNEMATIDHILRVREVLTPEQRTKFCDLIGECLCDVCEPGSTTCCATHSETNQTEEKE